MEDNLDKRTTGKKRELLEVQGSWAPVSTVREASTTVKYYTILLICSVRPKPL